MSFQGCAQTFQGRPDFGNAALRNSASYVFAYVLDHSSVGTAGIDHDPSGERIWKRRDSPLGSHVFFQSFTVGIEGQIALC